jgi:hypothetical protein
MDYFSDKTVVVQPIGVPCKVYNIMRSIQNTVPMITTAECVSVLKTTEMTGTQIITKLL